MVKIVKRVGVDLEKTYRSLITKIVWICFILVMIAEIMALPPFYSYGLRYYFVPFYLGAFPLTLVYYLITRNLSQPLESAKPGLFYSCVIGFSLLFASISYYSIEIVINNQILESERKAKQNIFELTQYLKDLKSDAENHGEIVDLNSDWNTSEFVIPLNEKFKNKLNWVKIGDKKLDYSDSIDDYYYFYRCSTLGVWHLWCVPKDHPYRGKKTFVVSSYGNVLSRDFRGRVPIIMQYPATERILKTYKEEEDFVFKIKQEDEETF